MKLRKNIKPGKVNIILKLFFFYIFFLFTNFLTIVNAATEKKFVEIKILDKVSSKNSELKIEIGKEKIFQNLSIKALKCKNSEFDDNPEITAYLQVIDTSNTSNDEVFVFNGWTFSSSPSIKPFDHPVYDIWLIKCY
tara:strand:- start:667 stop:1077 length:411 start_codon:yes stop_codon:yes gene_type:complete